MIFLIGVAVAQDSYWSAKVRSYIPLRKTNQSTYYQIDAPLVNDSRPVYLIELRGSHYQVGYDYGFLLAQEIEEEYLTFMKKEVPVSWQLFLLQAFLDWQFHSYFSKAIHRGFRDELSGIGDAAKARGKGFVLQFVRRVLVISSYPGDITSNIWYSLVNQFTKHLLGSEIPESKQLLLLLSQKSNEFAEWSKKYVEERAVRCSFFAVWGSRTQNGQLYSMRNLDWEANIGLNKHKLITVYRIDGAIPHATIGFAGVVGALTGISGAGLTAHEAGLDTKLQEVKGYQWTLRLRHVLMHAYDLKNALQIWKNTSNTFGMNHMIASAPDLASGHPAIVFQTNGRETAYFRDFDPRENGTVFTDPKTKKNFTAGYAMSEAVFRTNHAYDPKIRQKLISQEEQHSDSMIRYRLLKDGFSHFENAGTKIGEEQALSLTALVGDKGSEEFRVCPKKPIGINIISVLYVPGQLKMHVAFQYGQDANFRPACCAAYLEIDLQRWLGNQTAR